MNMSDLYKKEWSASLYLDLFLLVSTRTYYKAVNYLKYML